MQSSEIRKRFLEFFKGKNHAIIPSASLLPENYPIPDKGSLFTTAGMQPLIPYLLGEKHSEGVRLVSVQKCIRTGDIEDVGDNRHLTFFEMLGNWSLGDYFKKESIAWSLEFLTDTEKGLGLDPKRLFVTVFKGEDGIPRDDESIKHWKENFGKFNIAVEVAGEDEIIKGDVRIVPLGKEDNFWIAGTTGPCGGDTEIFYDVIGEEKGGKVEGSFQTLVKSGRIIEIWNNVFMEFNKKADGTYEKLSKPNVDTGMGLERTTVVMQEKNNVYETDLFTSLMKEDTKENRIVADHIKAAVFILSEGVEPSNTGSGYVLRRLIRRAVRYGADFSLAEKVIELYKDAYPELLKNKERILENLKLEEERFKLTLEKGLKELRRKFEWIRTLSGTIKDPIDGKWCFDLYQTHGFPLEMIFEELEVLAKIFKYDLKINKENISKEFDEEMKRHQELSRTASAGMFKGGLAGTSEVETRYHTATHLLRQALEEVLGEEIIQKGSNINTERLRFDFSFSRKLTDEEKQKVETLVNQKISESLPVQKVVMTKEEAEKTGAVHSFSDKYGDEISIYFIGDTLETAWSKEFCGGPHVINTKEVGKFKITKEEPSSAGVRRIRAMVE